MKKKKNLYKIILIIAVSIYVVFTLANQQKTLNQYNVEKEKISKQISEQEEYKEELAKKKEDVTSLDFIEQTAREKLDMYYPNERVYVDRGM